MGLSPLHAVGLTAAREAACKARAQLVRGIGPLHARRYAPLCPHDKTFDASAREYIASHQDEWRNRKHRRQWAATLETYASPHLGQLCVRDIDTVQVLKVLQPLWSTKLRSSVVFSDFFLRQKWPRSPFIHLRRKTQSSRCGM